MANVLSIPPNIPAVGDVQVQLNSGTYRLTIPGTPPLVKQFSITSGGSTEILLSQGEGGLQAEVSGQPQSPMRADAPDVAASVSATSGASTSSGLFASRGDAHDATARVHIDDLSGHAAGKIGT